LALNPEKGSFFMPNFRKPL